MKSSQRDHSNVNLKAELRRQNLPDGARVLDLFCGLGEMYRLVYRASTMLYHGVDNRKIHDTDLCTLVNNNIYITRRDMNQFNVFDLDDYGSPWKQLFLIMERYRQPEATFFITDGLILHLNLVSGHTRFLSATENIPRNFEIPGVGRWYIGIFSTMLLRLEQRYGYKVEKAQYFPNDRRTVYYWHIKIRKNS